MLHEPSLRRFGVKRPGTYTGSVWRANSYIQWRHPPVPSLGQVVNYLVKAAGNEVGKLHFNYRFEPLHSQAYCASDGPGFNNRRISNTILAELIEKSFSNLENAAVLSDILPKDDVPVIFFESLSERKLDGINKSLFRSRTAFLICGYRPEGRIDISQFFFPIKYRVIGFEGPLQGTGEHFINIRPYLLKFVLTAYNAIFQ